MKPSFLGGHTGVTVGTPGFRLTSRELKRALQAKLEIYIEVFPSNYACKWRGRCEFREFREFQKKNTSKPKV